MFPGDNRKTQISVMGILLAVRHYSAFVWPHVCARSRATCMHTTFELLAYARMHVPSEPLPAYTQPVARRPLHGYLFVCLCVLEMPKRRREVLAESSVDVRLFLRPFSLLSSSAVWRSSFPQVDATVGTDRVHLDPALDWVEADDVAKVRHMNKVLAGFQGEFEFEERLDDDLLVVRGVSLVTLPAPGGSCVSFLSGPRLASLFCGRCSRPCPPQERARCATNA